ncbi:hypothetical protein BU23DRAFT_548789 [Bimuria novae-zelandiae CBS 107.79]|uniref:Uncharacterized protein n=1 Tax=Bimuria novae-zelandiae CBS 107.79 TaxID=1447943 RepID=A0A6A5VSK5_9PLEO|nr:hypothetical protein BU23DRAFT_548789 [Bimuria novae-zelandiae CBS 107.79]
MPWRTQKLTVREHHEGRYPDFETHSSHDRHACHYYHFYHHHNPNHVPKCHRHRLGPHRPCGFCFSCRYVPALGAPPITSNSTARVAYTQIFPITPVILYAPQPRVAYGIRVHPENLGQPQIPKQKEDGPMKDGEQWDASEIECEEIEEQGETQEEDTQTQASSFTFTGYDEVGGEAAAGQG